MSRVNIDDYLLDERPIASGSTGEVYRASARLGGLEEDRVAIKLFQSMAIDRPLLSRLFSRYEKISHPLISPLLGHSLEGNPYYSITALDELGKPLDQCPPMDVSEAWSLIHQLVDAMGVAHKFGLIHGNLHPGNLMATRREDESLGLKVVDFGAGMIGEVHYIDLNQRAYFAAPEQLSSLGRDWMDGKAERWDVYRFGVIAYWLLNHAIPRGKIYRKQHSKEVAEAQGRPVPLDAVALGAAMTLDESLPWKQGLASNRREEAFLDVINDCLNLDPEKRPVDMRDVKNDFSEICQDLHLRDTIDEANHAVSVAHKEIRDQKRKQKAKLISARVLATLLAASCVVAGYYLVSFFEENRESNSKLIQLDQVVSNQNTKISILGEKVKDTTGELKNTREAVDATFHYMTRQKSSNTGKSQIELEKSRNYYVGLLKDLKGQKNLILEKSRALHSLAHIEKEMNRSEESIDHFAQAIKGFSSLESRDGPARLDIVMRLADCHENLALVKSGSTEESLAAVSKAVEFFKQAFEINREDTLVANRLAKSSFSLGKKLTEQYRFDEAIKAFTEAAQQIVAIRDDSQGETETRELDQMIARLQYHAALALHKASRYPEAVNSYIATIESIERLRSSDGYTPEETIMMANSFLELGEIFSQTDGVTNEDRDQVFNEALRLIVPLNRSDESEMQVALIMARALKNLAQLERAAGHPKDAFNLSLRGIETLQKAVKGNENEIQGHLVLAKARLSHIEFVKTDRNNAKAISKRAVQNVTTARELLIKQANSIESLEREVIETDLKKLFNAFGAVCQELGQSELASECLNYASLELSYRDK